MSVGTRAPQLRSSLRLSSKSQSDVGKVRVTGQHVLELELLHYDHRRQICEGDVRLVIVRPTKLYGSPKPVRPNPLYVKKSGVLSPIEIQIALERMPEREPLECKRDGPVKHMIGRKNGSILFS